jgi:hypothetical protein
VVGTTTIGRFPQKVESVTVHKACSRQISDDELDAELERSEYGDAPSEVTASTSLIADLGALEVLFGPRGVPEVSIWSKNVLTIV